MTAITEWAGPYKSEDVRGHDGRHSPRKHNVTVTLTSGHEHLFWDARIEENGKFEQHTPMAVVHPSGALEILSQSHTTHPKLQRTPAEIGEVSIITFAPQSWLSVTGPNVAAHGTAPMTPVSGWWAGFEYEQRGRAANDLDYAPVIGWQQTFSDGTAGLTAWVFNTKSQKIERLDRLDYGRAGYKSHTFTMTRPAGSNDWGM